MGSTEKDYEGKCPKCGRDVYSDQLFTEERGSVYHLSCYNKMKKEEYDNGNKEDKKSNWW